MMSNNQLGWGEAAKQFEPSPCPGQGAPTSQGQGGAGRTNQSRIWRGKEEACPCSQLAPPSVQPFPKLLLSCRQQEQPSFLTSTEQGASKTLAGNEISASKERFFSWLSARAVS